MKCKYCDEVYAGGAQRITKHIAKCHSAPSSVMDWARRRQALAQAWKDENNDAKELLKTPDGVADEGMQQARDQRFDRQAGYCDGTLP